MPSRGQLLTASFMDYTLPHADDVPPIDVAFIETPTANNSLGIKGAGECGTMGAAPAVINAIVDALAARGIRHIDMPATPEKIWRALQAARDNRQQCGERMSGNNKKPVVVIGGGIMGLSTAIWLLRSGRAVTIVDPGIARRPASFGNAGVLAACSVVPVTAPGLIAKAPLLDARSELAAVRALELSAETCAMAVPLPQARQRRRCHAHLEGARASSRATPMPSTRRCPAARRPNAGCRVPDTSSPTIRAQRSRPTHSPGVCGARPVSPGRSSRARRCANTIRRSDRRSGSASWFRSMASCSVPGGYIADLREVAASLGAWPLPAEAREFRLDAGRRDPGGRDHERRDRSRGGGDRDRRLVEGADGAARSRRAAGVRARLSRDAVRRRR